MKWYLFSLLVSVVLLGFSFKFISSKKKNQLVRICSIATGLMFGWCLFLVLQILCCTRFTINPVYFDYCVYIFGSFIPITIYFLGNVYEKTNIKFKKKYIWLFVIPISTLIILWTNDFHNLFYINYSIYIDNTVFGPWFYVYTIYEYILIAIGCFKLIRFTVKNSGFFSKQAILLLLGIAIPVIANLLGSLKIIPMTIYVTPICFTLTLFFIVISVFKFKLLDTSPIALQKIVDNISDSYLVLDKNGKITDFNKPFVKIFGLENQKIRGKDVYEFFRITKNVDKSKKILACINIVRATAKPDALVEVFEDIDKIFSIEISSLESNDECVGIVLLFKDITEHTKDMKKLEENQYIMQRQAQFSILGEFAGGLAHDLNSPLSAVQLDISTLQKYMKSDKIDAEPEVKNVILEMLENIDSSLNKMTKIIAGVRNQIRATGNTEKETFNLREIVDGIEILFGSILRKNNCRIENLVDENIEIYGEKNKLDRVIGNVIKNSIDAYMSYTQNGVITVFSKMIDDNCVIGIQDEAGGIPSDIAKTMFKEMKTTKAETGTGFGLYYSNTIIESSFGGKMSFETEEGKGTIFYISLPMIKEEV